MGLTEILEIIKDNIFIPVIVFIVYRANTFFTRHFDAKQNRKAIAEAESAIYRAVMMIEQKLVNKYKHEGTWGPEHYEEVKQECLKVARSIVGIDGIEAVKAMDIDFDTWAEATVEQIVAMKGIKPPDLNEAVHTER